MNARDLQIITDDYPAPHDVPAGVVPIAGELGQARKRPVAEVDLDGCGTVEAVGSRVTAFKVGDRVAPIIFQGYHHVSRPYHASRSIVC